MPPETLVFFVDRSLGKRDVPEALRKLGARVEIHDDHFARDTEDAAWIARVGKRNWVVLTKDQGIRHRPLEHAAVRAAKLRLFALTSGNLSGPEMAAIFSKHFDKIVRLSRGEPAPFIARISRSGIVLERLRS